MPNGKSDYYDILGISKSASPQEIKKAYRSEALKWHPDRHKDNNKEEAEKRFKEINEAYQILSDPQKKARYDQFGTAYAPGGASSSQGPFTYAYSTNGGNPFEGMDFGNPFDIFEQFFGGGFSRPRVPRYSIAIDFMDAIKGIEKEVQIEGKKRKIKIPPGVGEGSQINFGDFILSVNIRPSEIFERDGADIYVKFDISFSLAALGGTVSIPTVDGEVQVKIKGGTQPGTLLRLAGKGVPHLRGRGHGDQYVKINVVVPTRLSRNQRKIVEEMQEEEL